MKIRLFLAACCMSLSLQAANTVTTRSTQITSAVVVGTNTDYTLTLTSSLFSTTGSINIPSSSAEHSTIVFKNLKPSAVINNWLSYVRIDGAQAVNGTNCQVKMYGKGAIVMPYAASFKPLTCYTGSNFTGKSYNGYTTGSAGGYMKTLNQQELINGFRSFKLKRGYMVTFATGVNGYGYSRCFIADKEDLEMNLPATLSGKVSSYRLFVWNDAQKKGLASDASAAANNAVNSSWTYTWGVGGNMSPDVESIPHKIKKSWPSVAECGAVDWSCHMKTDNEPANSSDEEPATVDEILAYWEDAMRTGMRLLSPSSYDGGYAWQEQFMNAIDARGWRCDVLDMHCYWDSGSFPSLSNYYNKYHRPIWISEMLWGSSWNRNGIFAATSDWDSNSESNQNLNYNGGKPILDKLNGYAFVERYAWWNGERNCSKLYCNGALTKLGKYYADMDCGIGFSHNYEYVPAVVFKNPYSLVLNADESGNFTLTWKEANGDMMDEIQVQCRKQGSSTWQVLANIEAKDKNSRSDISYTYTGKLDNIQDYALRIVDKFDGKEYATNEARLLFTSDVTELDFIPYNSNDYFFQIFSKEAQSELVWALGNGTNTTDIYYKSPAQLGTDLSQLWVLEVNDLGGYTMRNLNAMGYVMCSPNSWNFVTNNTEYTSAAEKATYLPQYYTNGNYWVVRNVAHNTYVGLWDNDKNFGVGERLAGNRTNATGNDSGDKVGIRAIPRSLVNDVQGMASLYGKYYVYSPYAKLYLTAANSWGTQASLGETGADINFVANGLLYNLDTDIANGSENHYLGSNYYLDSEIATWRIAPSSTINGKNTYTFTTDGSKFMAAPLSGDVITTVANAKEERAMWMLFTKEELIAQMATATETNPMNVTFLLPGYGFSRNDRRNGNWQGNPVVGGDAINMNAEKFNTTFDVYQLLENVPNGIYEVSMQGYYRNGGYESAANSRQSGQEELNAIFYVNEMEVPLPSIFEGANTVGTTGVSTSQGYIPNSQTEASAYISAGQYAISPVRVTVDEGKLKIGIKKSKTVTNDWTLFDNFKIMYYGVDPATAIATTRYTGIPQTAIFDLSGRRLSTITRPGIYIVNNRKVIKK